MNQLLCPISQLVELSGCDLQCVIYYYHKEIFMWYRYLLPLYIYDYKLLCTLLTKRFTKIVFPFFFFFCMHRIRGRDKRLCCNKIKLANMRVFELYTCLTGWLIILWYIVWKYFFIIRKCIIMHEMVFWFFFFNRVY